MDTFTDDIDTTVDISITSHETKDLFSRYALALSLYVSAQEMVAEYKLNRCKPGGNIADVAVPAKMLDRLIEAIDRKREAQLAWWNHCGGILQAVEVEREMAKAGQSFIG